MTNDEKLRAALADLRADIDRVARCVEVMGEHQRVTMDSLDRMLEAIETATRETGDSK